MKSKKMRKFGLPTGLLALGLILLYFVLGLLTNYASTPIPKIFVDHPVALWGTILFILLLVAILTLLQMGHSQRITNNASNPFAHNVREPDMVNHKYDAFISYSHADAQWVHTTLVPRLRQHGFSVVTDSDFIAGILGVDQMEQGVIHSKHVLAVLSPEYFQSKWSKLENVMAQSLDPDALQRKLIPVMYKRTELPLRLAVIHYRDLTNDDSTQWKRLIEDLI